MRLNLLSGHPPGFAISQFLYCRAPGFRRNWVFIRSHPGFNLNLRHTNIQSISGLHSNWPSELLFGRIPSFAVPHTIIRSCSRLYSVSCRYLVVLQSSQRLIPLSGRFQASWYLLFLSGRFPGFTITCWGVKLFSGQFPGFIACI